MAPRISEAPLDPADALDAVAGDGAAACVFAGTVREENRGRTVDTLAYEAHGPLAERVLGELEEEAESEAGVRRCRIAHRVGALEVGEVSVVVAVAADDPDAAAGAAERAMDELKERLPVWKEERYADGETRWLDGSPLRGSPDPGADGAAGAAADEEPNGGAT